MEYNDNLFVNVICKEGRVKDLRKLIEIGLDVVSVDYNGWTPLHHAAASPVGTRCLKVLLDHNAANIDCLTHEGESALFLAIKHRSEKSADTAVRWLLHHDADPTIENDEGEIPLHAAIEKGHLLVVKRLVRFCDEDINRCDFYGCTPLHKAASMNSTKEMFKYLVKAGADIRAKDFLGKTPLFSAAQYGSNNILEILISIYLSNDYPDIVNVGSDSNTTPFMVAAQENALACLQTLIKHSANPDVINNFNKTALHYVFDNYHNDDGCLEFVLETMNLEPLIKEYHPFKAIRGKRLVSPLSLAINTKRLTAVELILSHGFHPDSVSMIPQIIEFQNITPLYEFETALALSIKMDFKEATRVLLEAGASPNDDISSFQPPMFIALLKPTSDYVQLLLDHGCNINHHRPANQDNNHLFLAALQNHCHLKVLLMRGYDALFFMKQISDITFCSVVIAQKDILTILRVLYLLMQFLPTCATVQRGFFMIHRRFPQHHMDVRWEKINVPLSSPSSLSHLCRLVIRNQMYSAHGVHLNRHIPDLPVPPSFKEYLLFRPGVKCFDEDCQPDSCQHFN